MNHKSLSSALLASLLLPSLAAAQLADGTYTTTDTTNANTGSATASTGTSGVKFLEFEYTKNQTQHNVKLAWSATAYLNGAYVDNVEDPTKRWWLVILEDGTRIYGYETKQDDGTWQTQSSGTY